MAAGFVGSTKSFPFSFDVDVEEEEPGRLTPHLSKRIATPVHMRQRQLVLPTPRSLNSSHLETDNPGQQSPLLRVS
ncbi:hypothetical protein KGM_212861 [Danaus plexippus plexippus]|uniref:Uncharacterized protein n=1 Tax=Danaus plexippus plexippus TaxID=278856 RepID=A0A212EHC5_DANPL|nr:hypothetical protein KGM_212861 [Danaus plexippus plexippus]